ncbi:hypothetical protein BaRGS_00006080 [Batillaria attramentaria]|uniref:Uncharacterized protein n=1 Tax=Batillaria attramentaria TaxID=370345 RepID=A0ABD0LUC0_9CAEN
MATTQQARCAQHVQHVLCSPLAAVSLQSAQCLRSISQGSRGIGSVAVLERVSAHALECVCAYRNARKHPEPSDFQSLWLPLATPFSDRRWPGGSPLHECQLIRSPARAASPHPQSTRRC